jgi:hypothetical protein
MGNSATCIGPLRGPKSARKGIGTTGFSSPEFVRKDRVYELY